MKRVLVLGLCTAVFCATRAAEPLDLDALRGRVVYLDFWASWCGPCRQSFPWMQKMVDAYGDRGFTVVAVNVDADRVAADEFLRRFHSTFDLRFDPKGELPERYDVKGMPASFLIDRRGVTRYRHVGFVPADEVKYEAQLRELLAEP